MGRKHEKPPESDYGHLVVGRRYRVARPFRDFDGHDHPAGETWIYEGNMAHPYDGGVVIKVRGGGHRSIRLLDGPDDQRDVLMALEEYIVPA